MGFNLSSLQAPVGASSTKKRLGRGDSSGLGGTSTKGHKGQRSRSGGFHKVGFEGGQTPLYRKVPKRGFVSPFKKCVRFVNVSNLNIFPPSSVVGLLQMRELNLIPKGDFILKILGDGSLDRPLCVQAHAFSDSAKKKILSSGGQCELLV